MSRLEEVLDEITKVERVHKGEKDVLYFGLEYFSEDLNPENSDNLIPSGVNYENSADFHKELTTMLNDVANDDVQKHIAWACPRGSGKSAWLSNIFLVHQVVYQLQKYIVLFSETTQSASAFVSWGKFQLKLNEKLRNDFGEQLHVRPNMNQSDNREEYITESNIMVQSKGLQTQTRGLRFSNSRVTLGILDDMESSESTNTSELIEKSKSWFREELLPALSKNGNIIYLGTILCYDSLLHHVIKDRKDFTSRKYASIVSYADREDLWKEWRRIYRKDSQDSTEKAYQFYKEREEEMLKGSEVLWKEQHTYYELMKLREDNGYVAFESEQMNNPTDEERQVFKPEHFTFYNEFDIEDKDLEFYGGIDFAMGKEKGDYSVIVTVAKNKNTNVAYVYDVFMQRVHPDELLEQAVNHTLKYQYEMLGVEAQMAQEWFADKLSEDLQSKGYPSFTRLKKIKQRTRKSLRIEALLPDIQSGRLRFHDRLRNSQEMAQFEMYPMHKFDDFPDCVSMAYTTAVGGTAIMRTTSKRMR